MFKRPVREIEKRSRNASWQKFVNYLAISAEASNVGIFLEVLGRWIPPVASFVAATPLAYLFLIGDPLIYFFRSLIRLTRLVGKNFFNIEFEEDKNGPPHKLHALGDLLSLSCFSLAVVFFCGALVAPPAGITLAWTMGLLGLGFVSLTDYVWPEKQAYKKYENLLGGNEATAEMKKVAYDEYTSLKKARQLYLGLIINLGVLLICGSAVAFAPPLLVPFLYVASNTASLVLGAIGCRRFYNWYTSHNNKDTKAQEELSASAAPASEIEMTQLGAQLKLPKIKAPSSPDPSPVLSSIPVLPAQVEVLSTSRSSNKEKSSSPSRAGFFSQSEVSLSPCSLEYKYDERQSLDELNAPVLGF